MGEDPFSMTRNEKLQYIREELERYKGVRSQAATEAEWIAFKLSCSVKEAARLIWLARGRPLEGQ